MNTTVLLPHGIARNRYVDEIARAWRARGHAVVQGPDALFEPRHRPALVHLQWPEELYRWHGAGAPAARARAFVERLDALKAGGARLAWTVHNLAPRAEFDWSAGRKELDPPPERRTTWAPGAFQK